MKEISFNEKILDEPCFLPPLKLYLNVLNGTVIGIMQPPPIDGARNVLLSNLSKSGLDNYVVKRSKRHLLKEVS